MTENRDQRPDDGLSAVALRPNPDTLYETPSARNSEKIER